MSKIIMNNVRIKAINGGSIRNYETIKLDDVDMEFSENSINFIIDEKVAILREVVESMKDSEIIELAKVLEGADEKKQKEILLNTKFSVLLGYAKDIKDLVVWITELAKYISV